MSGVVKISLVAAVSGGFVLFLYRLSKLTREVFAVYDPDFDAGSLDEAHLDVTDYCKDYSVTGAQVCLWMPKLFIDQLK